MSAQHQEVARGAGILTTGDLAVSIDYGSRRGWPIPLQALLATLCRMCLLRQRMVLAFRARIARADQLQNFDGFLVVMLTVVAAALLWPTPGLAHGVLHLATITQSGIAVVFFLHGVMLSREAIRAGATKWRLHLFVQLCTFAVFPLLGGLLFLSTHRLLTADLRLGFFFLCAMSSTISSSVAMTAMAKGDVASAVFNASASALIGMLVTPLLMQFVAAGAHDALPLGATVTGILLTLAVPFALGQLLRTVLLPRLLPYKPWVNKLDRGVIILIVYGSFCESTAAGIWAHFAIVQLLLTALIASLLLLTMLLITYVVARLAGFSREEQITAIFCGSKKSLASGAPMAKVIFAAHPGLGLIMLPLMLYHQIQILVCTILARRYAREAAA